MWQVECSLIGKSGKQRKARGAYCPPWLFSLVVVRLVLLRVAGSRRLRALRGLLRRRHELVAVRGDDVGEARHAPTLVARGLQDLAGDALIALRRAVARAVGVAAGGVEDRVGVAGRHDDGAPVIHHVVDRQDDRFLAAVRVALAGEGGLDLAGQFVVYFVK
jgi:hypothetical protein